MAIAKGVTSIMGIGKQTGSPPWTSVGVNATNKIPFTSEGLDWSPANVESEVLHGRTFKLGSRFVHLPVEGSIETEVWYDLKNSGSDSFIGHDMLWGMVCGDAGTFATAANYFLPADDFQAEEPFMTIACLVGDVVKEIPSSMINSCSIGGSAGSAITASFDIIGSKMTIDNTVGLTDIGGFDPANTTAELLALYDEGIDYADKHYNAATFNDVTFFLGDTVNALAGTDAIGISDFSISISNNLSGSEQSTTEASGHTNSYWNIEPHRNGMREVTLDFTIPRFSADTFHGYRDNQTELQAVVQLYKNATNVIDFKFPSIRIQSVDAAAGGSGLIPVSCSAKAYIPEHEIMKFGSNSGVTVNREFGIETINQRTAKPW